VADSIFAPCVYREAAALKDLSIGRLSRGPHLRLFASGDAAYDSDGLRRSLVARGTMPVIPNNPTRKRLHPFDRTAYRQRNMIERMFCPSRTAMHRHPLRQARFKLRRSSSNRRYHHLVDLIESGAGR
jgi:hypothetical protein